jgi:tetratricopeptide (TPR) repeat protein
LGLTLFIWQRGLVKKETGAWSASCLISGLLFCVHPYWGLMGAVQLLPIVKKDWSHWPKNAAAFVFGLSPYLWIWFRADKFFPSWGGVHPFSELFRQTRGFLTGHFTGDWSFWGGFYSLGWIFWCLVFLTWGFSTLRGQAASRSGGVQKEWSWIGMALLGAGVFYSRSTQLLGPTAVFLPLGLVGIYCASLGREIPKKGSADFPGTSGRFLLAGLLTACLGFMFLPGQSCWRGQTVLPQRHALNLIQTFGGKSVLVCEDPFEADACLEMLFLEPSLKEAVILEKRFLNQRWYLEQAIRNEPGLFFSGSEGDPGALLKQLILENKGLWEVHWAVSRLPFDWKGPPASALILTQRFAAPSLNSFSPESVQYRFDLSPLLEADREGDPQTLKTIRRYSLGLNEMGNQMLRSKNYAAAIRVFERASKLDPSYSDPRDALDRIYSQHNILGAARLSFESAIKTLPARIQGLNADLERLRKGGNPSEIVRVVDEMIRANTELSDAQYQLGLLYEKEGRLRDSKSLLESSKKLNPKRVESQMALARLIERMGNRLKAEEAYRSVLMMEPENKEAQKELWRLLNKP